jgi:hypothetical protein
MKAHTIFVCISGILLICSTVSAGKYPLTWTPESITEAMGLMDSDTFSVILSSDEDIGPVNLWVVPELQPFISVSPTNLYISAGNSYPVTITCTIPSGTTTGPRDGTIHIKCGEETIPATFKVELKIFNAVGIIGLEGGIIEVI